MRTAPWRGLGLRGRLLVSVLAAMGLLLASLTLAFNLVLADRLNGDANSAVQSRASAELGNLAVSAGRIRLPEAPDERSPDTPLWVFQATHAVEQPRAPLVDSRVLTALAQRAPASLDVTATHTRLYALPVAQAGHRVGAVVASVSLGPYEQTRHTALVASVALALAVFLASALAAGWLISKALRPVASMTRRAAEWSEHDLDRRFSLGDPHDELTQLAFTLDKLLDRLAASLRHEQRLSAELSHELRTPLASITADAQYALRHTELSVEGTATLERILQSTAKLGRTLDTLIAAARAQLDPHHASSDAGTCARAAASSPPVGAHEQPTLRVEVPRQPIRVAVDQDLVERILAPLVENACRYALTEVLLAVSREGAGVLFEVHDDGPGVAEN